MPDLHMALTGSSKACHDTLADDPIMPCLQTRLYIGHDGTEVAIA